MRIIPPSERNAGGPSGRIPKFTKKELQHQMARQAVIEATKARYLKLVCGHYQTLEEDERVSHWRPKKGVTWCENCSQWTAIKRPSRVDNTPDQPLF